MGGRLDCTNVADGVVAVITPISIDHTRLLGDTLEEIAAEKAGIFNPRVPAIVAAQPREALAAIEREAAAGRPLPPPRPAEPLPSFTFASLANPALLRSLAAHRE